MPLNLLPENPSQSPPVDSRSGWGVYTGNWDGSPPSLAVLPVLSGSGMGDGGSRSGGSWLCAGHRTAAASCACTAGAAAGLGDDAGAGAGEARVADETCSWQMRRGHFA